MTTVIFVENSSPKHVETISKTYRLGQSAPQTRCSAVIFKCVEQTFMDTV